MTWRLLVLTFFGVDCLSLDPFGTAGINRIAARGSTEGQSASR